MHITLNVEEPPPELPVQAPLKMREVKIDPLTGEDEMMRAAISAPASRGSTACATCPSSQRSSTWGKVQRNAPCPAVRGANSSTATVRWSKAAFTLPRTWASLHPGNQRSV